MYFKLARQTLSSTSELHVHGNGTCVRLLYMRMVVTQQRSPLICMNELICTVQEIN